MLKMQSLAPVIIMKNPGTGKTKNLLISLLIGLLLLLVLVPIYLLLNKSPVGPSNESGPVNLTYWGLYEPAEVIQPLIDTYQKSNPNVKITYEEKPYQDDLVGYKNLIFKRLQNGTGPSIFRMHSTWVPKLMPEIAQNSYPSFNYDSFIGRFNNIYTDSCADTQGDIYCMPLMYDGLVLLYNKDLFSKNSLQPPQTWGDLILSAKKLTIYEKDGLKQSGIALGTTNNVANSTDIIGLMMAQSGIAIPSEINSESALRVFKYYQSFSSVEKFWNTSFPDSVVAFVNEDTAMIFAKLRDIERINELNPTLNYGVSPVVQIPTYEGGKSSETWASIWVESVSKDLTEKEILEAWKFLEWMSQKDQQVEKYRLGKEYRKYGELPANKELEDTFSQLTNVGVFVAQSKYAKTSIIADNAGNDDYTNLIKELYKSEIGMEALTKAKAKFEKLIK
jgi:ABC-type glycerol-3-phosphate transport system substrate-binding protein